MPLIPVRLPSSWKVSCSKHPNADKLTVTQVDVGMDEPIQIVCGAPNVAAGQKVPGEILADQDEVIPPSGRRGDQGFF